MTVERGRPWGSPGRLPDGGVVARNDAEARAAVERARRAGDAPPPIGLLGGDLCRTVGGRGDEARLGSGDAMCLPCDLGAALVDGRLHWFVAHLVARRSWWRGPVLAAMNAQWLGRWDVAPRAHPGDGLLDVLLVDPSVSVADRWKAWRRLPSGTHVPHAGIAQRRAPAVQEGFDRPVRVWLDGVPIGSARSLSIRVEPDALLVVV